MTVKIQSEFTRTCAKRLKRTSNRCSTPANTRTCQQCQGRMFYSLAQVSSDSLCRSAIKTNQEKPFAVSHTFNKSSFNRPPNSRVGSHAGASQIPPSPSSTHISVYCLEFLSVYNSTREKYFFFVCMVEPRTFSFFFPFYLFYFTVQSTPIGLPQCVKLSHNVNDVQIRMATLPDWIDRKHEKNNLIKLLYKYGRPAYMYSLGYNQITQNRAFFLQLSSDNLQPIHSDKLRFRVRFLVR